MENQDLSTVCPDGFQAFGPSMNPQSAAAFPGKNSHPNNQCIVSKFWILD
jgi:hypothetical protein